MRRLALILICLGAIWLGACAALPAETLPEEEIYLPTLTEAVTEPWVDWVDDAYPYDLSGYLTLPPLEGVRAEFDDSGVCTDKELEEAVMQIRLNLAEFEKKTGKIELYDRVKLSFDVVMEGQTLSEMSVKEMKIVVGLDGYESTIDALSDALPGFSEGETCWVEYCYPSSPVYGEMAGKNVVIKGNVISVEKPILPQVDEKFVQSLEGFEKATPEDFYESVRADVIEGKKKQKVKAVWGAFCQDVTVLSYPEEEMEAYREEYVLYYTSMAESLGTDLEDFLQEYAKLTPEEFEREKEIYAEEMVKNDMIFTQLIRLTGVTVTQEEYESGARAYFEAEKGDFKSFEEFERYYSREQILENLVRDKALLVVVEKAVCKTGE